MPGEETIEGHRSLRLRDGDLEAAFLPEVGMVGVSLRHRGAELISLAGGLQRYAKGQGTAGIPLLHPWANRMARDDYSVAGIEASVAGSPLMRRDANGLAIHGLLGGSRAWALTEATDDALRAELDAGAQDKVMAGFPFPHRLTLDVTLRDGTLTLRTTLTAGPDRPVPVAYGFHPYLVLPGVARADWRVELPAMRRLELDARGVPTGAGAPAPAWSGALAQSTFDDAFDQVAPGIRFALSGGGRRITVAFDEGFPTAQVFAPDGRDVVCFEPMTAPANALVSGDGLVLVAPGERHVTAFSIRVGSDGA